MEKEYEIKVEVTLKIKSENLKVAKLAARSWDGASRISSIGKDSYILTMANKRKITGHRLLK